MQGVSKKRHHAKIVRQIYHTEKGQEYEKRKRRFLRSRFSRGIYAAKKRSKEWTITYEQYQELLSRDCSYCNRDLGNETGHGLDRINNDLGYSFENVNPCCKDCNRRRSKSMSAEEFKIQTKLNGRWHEKT
jgi:5-methylcytosine-specific restriction endonuclease McrA